ncbi:ATP-binding cassette domain-containing protein, partial [Candidatus Uhrbacteria bacterium]|nr:ATP-binding cassette domain-containing protein [Candidatus Uhrbacteria bacterium]
SGSLSLALDAVTHWYDKGTPFETKALSDISLTLSKGTSTALIGPVGSGKTTLLEIAAGVTVPTEGSVKGDGGIVRAMAFQFPEDHLFGDTVESYVAFGPENTGVRENEIHEVDME